MEDKKRLENIPSNYVTLAQLREQWLKQKQKKNEQQQQQREGEGEGEEKKFREQQNEQKEEHNPQFQQLKDGPANRRNSNPQHPRKGRNSKQIDCGASREEKNDAVAAACVVVEGNETKQKKETERERKNGNRKKGERGKGKRKEEENMMEEKREDENVAARESEGNIAARRRDARSELAPKITGVVDDSNLIAKVENAVEEKIEQRLRALSVRKESDRLEAQIRIVNRGNSDCRDYSNSIANGGNVGYRGNNRIGHSRNLEYRGYNWIGNGRNFERRGYNGQRRGSYMGFRWSREWNGRYSEKVWVKKGEVADGGEDAGKGSSSNSVKELDCF